MTFIVIYDDCQQGNEIFQIEENQIWNRFDVGEISNQEVSKRFNDYIENLKALDGQLGGSSEIDEDVEKFLAEEFGDKEKRFWPQLDTSESFLVSGYFRIIQTGWIA